MIRSALVVSGWLILLNTAQGASFDCAKAGTSIEKMICQVQELSDLDEKLATTYKIGLGDESRADAVRHAQKQWIKNRNKCTTTACLKHAYEERLSTLASGASESIQSIISSAKAQSICNEVLELANTGKLEPRFSKFIAPSDDDNDQWSNVSDNGMTSVGSVLDITSRDGKVRHLGIITGGGTCSAADIVDLGSIFQSPNQPVEEIFGIVGVSGDVEDDENLRWAGWARSDYLLVTQGEPIIVTVRFYHQSADLALVSWFGEGKKRPLCAFSPIGIVKAEVTENKLPPLCNSVASGKVESIRWIDDVDQEERKKLGERVDGALSVTVDLNMDLKVDKVFHAAYASGAGCGAYYEWLNVDLEGNEKNPKSPLATVLRNFSGPLARHAEEWKSIRVLSYANKPYLLADGPGGIGVYSVWKDRIQTWCKFNFLEQSKIEKLYAPER